MELGASQAEELRKGDATDLERWSPQAQGEGHRGQTGLERAISWAQGWGHHGPREGDREEDTRGPESGVPQAWGHHRLGKGNSMSLGRGNATAWRGGHRGSGVWRCWYSPLAGGCSGWGAAGGAAALQCLAGGWLGHPGAPALGAAAAGEEEDARLSF